MPERDIPIIRPAVSVEVEPIAIFIVISAPGLLPAVVSPLVTPLLATLLAPVVAVGVARAAFLAVARDFPVFQVRVSPASLIGGPVIISLCLVLLHEIARHFLETLAGHLDITERPNRRQELPVTMLALRTSGGSSDTHQN